MSLSSLKIAAATIAVAALGIFAGQARADVIVPNIATGTPTVDRYAADSFGNIGTFEGRDNVLGITIGPNGAQPNRPAANSAGFYDYQGSAYSLGNAPASDLLSMDLWIPDSWSDPANGAVRTAMWGVMVDSAGNRVGYPIIGFTNDNLTDNFVGFEVYNDQTGLYQDLTSVSFNTDAWNTLAFDYDAAASSYNYFVNGTEVASVLGDSTVANYQETIFNSLNYADPNRVSDNGPPVVASYDVRWSNTPVPTPEPGSLPILGSGLALLGLVGFMRSRQRRTSAAC